MNAAQPLDELDFQIMYARSLGLTWEETGDFVQTPEFPTGVSEKTCRNRYERNKPTFDRIVMRWAGRIRAEQEQFEQITKAKYLEKLASLRHKAVRVKEAALDAALASPEFLSIGVKVADGIEDRDFGRTKQPVVHEGDVNHNVLVWTTQTAKELLAQEHDMLDSDGLLKSLPGEVLEGEVVGGA